MPGGVYLPSGALEQRALALGHVHRRARPFGEIGDAQQVVEVPVRHEDPGTACAETRQRQTQLGRVAARIDDDGLVGADGRSHDVAVRAHRSERQLVDAERHRVRVQLPRRASDPPLRAARRWAER